MKTIFVRDKNVPNRNPWLINETSLVALQKTHPNIVPVTEKKKLVVPNTKVIPGKKKLKIRPNPNTPTATKEKAKEAVKKVRAKKKSAPG